MVCALYGIKTKTQATCLNSRTSLPPIGGKAEFSSWGAPIWSTSLARSEEATNLASKYSTFERNYEKRSSQTAPPTIDPFISRRSLRCSPTVVHRSTKRGNVGGQAHPPFTIQVEKTYTHKEAKKRVEVLAWEEMQPGCQSVRANHGGRCAVLAKARTPNTAYRASPDFPPKLK